ncbi:MAG: UDP-N-acetylglucosamine 2-epimerase (non-hydrolyzing) [Saprospiraceae bacterium]|nr:UDP-N-acetylglucosamine 2-epimerase (non-hydrolyzing) [Saprospiraceae bacterium]
MILVCFGTRPEVVKLAPVIWELSNRRIPYKLVFTGQHRELFDDVSHLVPPPDYHLNIMKDNQTLCYVLSEIIKEMDKIIRTETPQLIIVQGDTSTVLASALAAFNNRIPIGHVEAGLRTYDLKSPFPEEANRQIVSRIATYNWAPTQHAVDNLKKEGAQNIWMTGNTVIDTCRSFDYPNSYGNKILITLHRRENFGSAMEVMFIQLNQLAEMHPELDFVFPMHPNPQVQKWKHLLAHVSVSGPLSYLDMMKLLSEVKFVITDSGGIQEECAAFRKRVLVCRDTTERPEGIQAGMAKLIGTKITENFAWANEQPEWTGINPYGDGNASQHIVDTITTRNNV